MFDHLVGQKHIKELLAITIDAAKKKEERIPDLLFSGPGGVGKSTFAEIIAQNADCDFVVLNATSVRSMEELIDYTTINAKIPVLKVPGENFIYLPKIIFFIDEAHKIKDPLKTELLNALEGKRQTTVMIKRTGEVFTLDFNCVSFIIATTDKNDLPGPLLSRFSTFELKPYSNDEITEMIFSKKQWDKSVCNEIAKRCKNVMRTAVIEMNRFHDYLIVKNIDATYENVIEYYENLRMINSSGLDHVDKEILQILANSKYSLGLKAIASRLRKNVKEIEEREAYLSYRNFTEKTGSGRTITSQGLLELQI